MVKWPTYILPPFDFAQDEGGLRYTQSQLECKYEDEQLGYVWWWPSHREGRDGLHSAYCSSDIPIRFVGCNEDFVFDFHTKLFEVEKYVMFVGHD